MLDIKIVRDNPDVIKKALEKRGQDIPLDELISWDNDKRKLIGEMETLREKRNKFSEQVGVSKRQGKETDPALINEMNQIREDIKEKERFLVSLEQKIEDFLLRIPNIPDETTPLGKSAQDNKVVSEPKELPKYDFTPLNHWEIGEKLGILDFDVAAKLSGSRFAFIKGDGCVLERALISFMLDTHKQKGYTEVLAPYLVNKVSITGTGQLPKFEEEVFKCMADELYLIPTAEVSVTNIHRDEIIDEDALPKKYVSYSACFRREAGSYGKDTKGLIRNHQFNKVELVKTVKPEDSKKELDSLVEDACDILKKLGIPFRVIELCTGDIGFSSAKTFDLEVWMPGEKRFREISSCSNFKDFQARRMNIKVRYKSNKKEFVHTINGSGLAIGRTFAAILENFQTKDGRIIIPEALRPYTKISEIKK